MLSVFIWNNASPFLKNEVYRIVIRFLKRRFCSRGCGVSGSRIPGADPVGDDRGDEGDDGHFGQTLERAGHFRDQRRAGEGRPHRAREQAGHAEHEIRGKLRFGGKTVSDEQGPAHGADHAADGEHGHEQAAGHAGGEAQDGEDDLDEQEERHRAEQERAVGREPAEIGCGIAEAHEHLRIDVQQDTAEQEGQERLEGGRDQFLVVMEFRHAEQGGIVERSTSTEITVRQDDGKLKKYKLTKFQRSNQSNCYNQRPIVDKGERVEAGQVIADGPSTSGGEMALGKNPLIGFMTWEGYNYEDAVLLSERLVQDDVYTSVHIEEYEAEARDTKLGPEEITRDIPGVGDDALKDLDERGIIRIGAEVRAGDILVGKVTPKGETELTAEERLLRAIFGEKAREVRDTSLKVPHGEYGIVVDAKVFTRENGDELSPGVNQAVRIYIAQKRKISVGDKMAGRHGNKGVVSRVLPVEDMPFLPNGRPLDIVLNPLGVPSRMNIGQVLEIHLSLAAKALGFNVSTPVFAGANENDIMDTLDLANDYVNLEWDEFEKKHGEELRPEVLQFLSENRDHRELWKGVPLSRDGKVRLRDGRTGEYFDSPVTIGHMHYLKLHHLVDDKIHARSTGPYSLVTQQPLGGKAQFGGQRFGEMEVWALEAYGASYTLQEILTVKSDDVVGRVKTYEAIIKGENIPEPGVPESFKVLLKELQSLALDVRVLRDDNTEVKIMESVDYGETDLRHIIEGDRKYRDENESFRDHGFTEKEFVGEELEDVELNEEPDDSDLENLSFDDDDYLGEE